MKKTKTAVSKKLLIAVGIVVLFLALCCGAVLSTKVS